MASALCGYSDPDPEPRVTVPLDYAARCERYARQRGWAYDPPELSIGHLTPRQRRRALRKERRSWRGYADAYRHDEFTDDPEPYDDDYDPHDLGYCVTPGCNCCGDDDD